MNALRMFQPFAAPELFRRARPADFLENYVAYSAQFAGWCVFVGIDRVSSKRIAGPFNTREDAERYLGPKLKETDMQRPLRPSDLDKLEAERSCYRQINTKALKAHAVVIQMASHGRIGQERAAELAWHDMPRCQGGSCRQGRTECKEGCNPLPEMSCTAGEEPPMPWWTPSGALFAAVAIGVILLGVWLY